MPCVADEIAVAGAKASPRSRCEPVESTEKWHIAARAVLNQHEQSFAAAGGWLALAEASSIFVKPCSHILTLLHGQIAYQTLQIRRIHQRRHNIDRVQSYMAESGFADSELELPRRLAPAEPRNIVCLENK